MKEHIEAIQAALTAAGITNYYVAPPPNTTPPLPRALVWSGSGVPGPEQSVAGADGDLTDQIGITYAASTGMNVLIFRERGRAALAAGITVAGRVVTLTLTDSRPVLVDTDVTPNQPYGVDLYRLISVPA